MIILYTATTFTLVYDVLILESDNTQTIQWYVDATFAVQKVMKSHTGAVMTMGSGAVNSLSN